MTDQEINRRLALAIGYRPDEIRSDSASVSVSRPIYFFGEETASLYWKIFDYSEPAVIWPIIVRYYCFPKMCGGEWMCQQQWGDTPEKAAALAVIRLSEIGALK